MSPRLARILFVVVALAVATCGDPDGDAPNTEADELGVGAACASSDDCNPEDADTDGAQDQQCLTNFKGGYCGLEGCTEDEDCPEASRCVAHDDGVNYCFRVCVDKAECNANRPPDAEANCSSNITFVEAGGSKACVPPSG